MSSNQSQDLVLHPKPSPWARQPRRSQRLIAASGREKKLQYVLGLLYLQLPWDIVAAIPAVLVRSYWPRTIDITDKQISIRIGKHRVRHVGTKATPTVAIMLKELVVESLMAEFFDTSLRSEVAGNKPEVARSLIDLISKEIVKSSVLNLPCSFPSNGHPSRKPLPDCLTEQRALIEHVDFNLTLYPRETDGQQQYYYPADLYTLQQQISNIKTEMPFLKTIHVFVKEFIGLGFTGLVSKTYIARSHASAATIARRIQTPGSFACEEETTIEEELDVLKVIMKTIPGLGGARVTLEKVQR